MCENVSYEDHMCVKINRLQSPMSHDRSMTETTPGP